MGSFSDQATTFAVTNYVGELFKVTPADTPFLSMIGGLTGGEAVHSKHFTWQTVDNNAAAQPDGLLEGANPTYSGRTRTEVSNVCQIFQEGVEVSYTKQAAWGNIGSTILGDQPVHDELSFQLMLKLEKVARDVEYTFLQGAYQSPADNTTGRKTRGIITATSTNAVAAASATLNKGLIDQLLRTMYSNGAPFRNPVIFVNAFQKQKLSEIYGYAPESRNVGGVDIQTIETDFGRLGVALDRHMPAATLQVADVSVCKPKFLAIPDKGHFFMEPLAKTGAAEKWQLYGEIGLEYGPETWHGKITGLATS